LVQDGILKLVQDRVKKTYVKGKNSMIEFYKRMDRVEGKHKCDLTDRISTILNEIQNYDRKGMSSHVQRNRDFPPSIEKNISLVYQNLWYPDKTNFEID
jgi:ABC-type phosphate transport system ATPase subunit